jgi:hypothetical protein
VYDPPSSGLPYLAVLILPNGEVVAKPFPTAQQAEAHNRARTLQAADQLARDKNA